MSLSKPSNITANPANPFGWDAAPHRRALNALAWLTPLLTWLGFSWVFWQLYTGNWQSQTAFSGWSQVLSVLTGWAFALLCRWPIGPIVVAMVATALTLGGMHVFGTGPTLDLDLALLVGAFLSAATLMLHLAMAPRLANALASSVAGRHDLAGVSGSEEQPGISPGGIAASRQEDA